MNRRIFRPLACTAMVLAVAVARPAAMADEPPQQAAIRDALAKFGQAFNSHDAAALGAAWAEDGVYADAADGVALAGRQAIQDWYAALFAAQPDVKLTAKISEIEVAGDADAFVRGAAEVASGTEAPNRTSFLAQLVKAGDQWLVASVEESDPDPLADLDWLVGVWKDEREDSSVESTFAWEGDGRFLVRKYAVTDGNGSKRSGTQYIVGDPATGTLKSWTFDSKGAVAEGEWTAKEDRWAIHWAITLPDGRKASATQAIKPVDQDTFEVKWSDIDVDGDLRPSTDPVTVRRVAAAGAAETTTEGSKP